MFTYQHQIRVRYGDTDQMGYVYYGNYGYYYEQARSEAIRSIGISYKQIEDSGTMMPITRMNIKYIRPAYYDELLTIKTTVPALPHRLILFTYEVYNEKNELINEGETQLAFIDAVTKKLKTAPAILLEKMGPFWG
ncbi:MAG TPA: acyl-CoA thioesterase [Chitinophagales bacterium]|nr:acyl-CoA thioesterase [Chitinophagales bacterium]